MKRFFLFIILIVTAMNVSAQSDTIVVKESVYDYVNLKTKEPSRESAGTAYVWCIDIVNNSNENYLTWINRTDNEGGYGDANQIRDYFVNANPSLFYIWEHFGYSEIMMGRTFLKLIRPKETFSYFIIKNTEGETRLKNRISIVKESTVKEQTHSDFLVSERFEEPYLFNQNSIFLVDDFLIVTAMNVSTQSDTIVVKESVYDYDKDVRLKTKEPSWESAGTAYVWCIDIVNNSNENYLTWINRTDNEGGYGDANQIRDYFVNANPSLFYIWEHFGYSEIMMGRTFLKLIRPKETFTYFIIKNKEGETRLKNRISIVKESTVKEQTHSDFLVSERFEEPYLFNQDSIFLVDE